MRRKIARIVAHPDARLLVAQAGDGGVLGFIGLHFIVQLALPGDFCRITYFCVGEAARGLGVGRELEETAARLARARLRPHRGALPERRVDAHRFYYRQGYEESPKYLMKRA